MLEDSGDMGELGHNRAKEFLNSSSYKAMIAYKLLIKNSTVSGEICKESTLCSVNDVTSSRD